jgi:hypothetical protein
MKSKSCQYWITAVVGLAALALAGVSQAQTVTNPCPNNVISWNFDDNSTIQPADLAGLAPATHWVDTWLKSVTTAVPDNSGNPTTLNIGWHSYGGYSIQGHPGYDANGTANRELLNGFLNNGYSTWETAGYNTNNILYFTNIPYATYDVIVYVSDDTSGRHYTVDDGNSQIFYGATVASSEVSGANALFLPATSTNSASFPQADFVVFRGETNSNLTITQTMGRHRRLANHPGVEHLCALRSESRQPDHLDWSAGEFYRPGGRLEARLPMASRRHEPSQRHERDLCRCLDRERTGWQL